VRVRIFPSGILVALRQDLSPAVDVRDLVDRAARGEPKAWEALMDRFGRLIEGILWKFRDLDDGSRRDVFQETRLGLLRGGLARLRVSTVPELDA